MILALSAAAAGMVVAIVSAAKAVVRRQEMDDRDLRSSILAAVFGTLATLLSIALDPEIIRAVLICLLVVITVVAIALFTKVTGIATMMTSAVLRWRRQRRQQNASPNASPPGVGKQPGQSSATHSPNSQHPDVDATTTGGAT